MHNFYMVKWIFWYDKSFLSTMNTMMYNKIILQIIQVFLVWSFVVNYYYFFSFGLAL